MLWRMLAPSLSLAWPLERPTSIARLPPVQMNDGYLPGSEGPAVPATKTSAFGAETIKLTPGSPTFLVGALIKRDRYKTLQNS